MSRNARLRSTIGLCLLLAVSSLGAATDTDYKMPPDPLPGIVDTPPTPTVLLSPDRTWMLLIERPNLPSIVELAEPELRLAGRRIRPRTNGPSRGSYVTGLTLKRMSDLSERPITNLPEGARLGNPRWSPDGTRIAFTVTGETDIRLWVAEVEDGLARRVPCGRLNATGGSPFRWLPDSQRIVCTAVPEGRGAEPAAPHVPEGPVVQENIGKTAPARTYQDLLENAHDEKLFEYYLTSQLVLVDVDRKSRKIGSPGIVWDFDPSPDGRYLLVEIIHRPFSYLVPASRFPRRIEVWDHDGNLVHQVADLELKEEVPTGFG
ncbi:MAG: S9 family peptidase, partial [Acidobacteriota bacterium]|nr:S9 family peptidase [Acidobacteriota bacterium]